MKTKTAIVCAWRQGEDDLQATMESAAESIGVRAKLYAVEDKDRSGPGRTRHRGIVEARDADVIVIVDAHMRFQGDALRRMVKAVKDGGLVCPLTHHNADCSFTGNPYSGARIVYRAKDGAIHTALAGKWSRESKPGPRGCVMGGCYAFRREWYMEVGAPLEILKGWGCDEEALSIAAWMSGQKVSCIDAVVAHRWRQSPPWKTAVSEFTAVRASRMALINAFVTNPSTAAELKDWQRRGVSEGVQDVQTNETRRVSEAMARYKRTWEQWRANVCEADEIDGVQAGKPNPVPVAQPIPRANYGAEETDRRCRQCGSTDSDVTHTRRSGRVVLRYRVCCKCKARRVGREVMA